MTDGKANSTGCAADEKLKQIICQTTGHRVGDLDAEQLLEADLGLDSIKTVQILSQLLSSLPEEIRERIGKSNALQAVLAAETLGDLFALYRTWTLPDSPTASLEAEVEPKEHRSEGVPLLPAQYPLLVAHLAVSTCSLVTSVTVDGHLEVEVLEAAYSSVVERHPMLRASVAIPANATSLKAWTLRIVDELPVKVDSLDLHQLSPTKRTEFLDAFKHDALSHTWDLREGPLHRLTLARLGTERSEIIFSNHHVVSDGLSNHLVIEELLQTYQILLSEGHSKLQSPFTTDSYRRIVEALSQWTNDGEGRPSDQLRRPRMSQMRIQGTAVEGGQRIGFAVPRFHRVTISGNDLRLLNEVVRTLDVSLNSVIAAALMEIERDREGANGQCTVNVPTGGRNFGGEDLSEWIGCFAQNVALTFPARPDTQSWPERLRFVHSQIQKAVSNGWDRAETRAAAQAAMSTLMLTHGQLDETMSSIVRAGMHVDRYLSFVGRVALKRDYGAFRVFDYFAATTTNAGTMDCLVELVFDELHITINYDSSTYPVADVIGYGDRLLSCLREVATAVSRIATNLRTPSSGATIAKGDGGGVVAEVLSAISIIRRVETTLHDVDAHLGADLGIDSLQRVRLAVALAKSFPGSEKRELVDCRTPNELVEALQGRVNSDGTSRQVPYLEFLRAAKRWPTNLAVLSRESSLTYQELEHLSGKLAAELQRRGVTRGLPVGLLCQPGAELVLGMLAILRAGGAYVPLDPEYPIARLKYMTGHAGVAVLVTHSAVSGETVESLSSSDGVRCVVSADLSNATTLSGGNATAVLVDAEQWHNSSSELTPVASAPDDPMVILYTSGSTGVPKGVELAHRGYANRFEWHQELFGAGPGDRVAQRTSCCFDVSVWELLWPLLHGATVCPVARAITRNPWALAEWMESTGIHVMHFVPSLFSEFVRAIDGERFEFRNLRWLLFSGEALLSGPVREFRARYGERIGLANLYGPTEASIDVTTHIIEGLPREPSIPIGRAMPGCRVVILNDDGSPCQIGEVGQIWLGGVQLAKSYWRNANATADAFKRVYLPSEGQVLLYRTGDLGVELANGEFDFRGRIDGQIKIRGFRVELGEIEAALATCEGVSECAVVAADSDAGDIELVAFVAGDARPTQERLRAGLSARLPHYMVPHRFVFLDKLPLNPNGKLDRRTLLATLADNDPPMSIGAATRGAAAPATPHRDRDESTETERYVPLGPAQSWLLRYFAPPYRWYGFTQFEYRHDLDWPVFQQALDLLTRRHEALRTCFERRDGRWCQVVKPASVAMNVLTFFDRRGIDEATCRGELAHHIREEIRQLSIERLPLWRVTVMRVDQARFVIAVAGHHLISDMLSNEILFRDMWQIYAELLDGAERARALPGQYRDLVTAVEEERRAGHLVQHARYYMEQFPSREYAFTVPVDHRKGQNNEGSAATESLVVANGARLVDDARRRGRCSAYALLAAGVYAALSDWTSSRWVVVSHRSHGRDLGDGRCFPDAVGNFAVNYPMGITIEPSETADVSLSKVAEKLRSLPMKGVTYDAIADELPSYLYPDNALTPVRLNYLGDRNARTSDVFAFDDTTRDQRFLPPDEQRTVLIEIFLSLCHGDLKIELNYSRNFHRAETIRALADRIGERVQSLAKDVGATSRSSETALGDGVARNGVVRDGVARDGVARREPTGNRSAPQCGTGRVAIVTGAGRGIGRAIALTLANSGVSVVVTSRTARNVKSVVDEIVDRGGRCMGVASDVTRIEDVQKVVAETLREFGRIDVLVNNAGTTMMASLEQASPSEWKHIVDVNLFGTYHFCREVVPVMRRQKGGKIINLGSDSSVIGYPLFGAYAASKHAVLGLTKSLAEELKQEGIQVNAVCPALVDTDMAPASLRPTAIAPQAIADVVAFLASPESNAITGEAVRAYGTQDLYWFGSRQAQQIVAVGSSKPRQRSRAESGKFEAE